MRRSSPARALALALLLGAAAAEAAELRLEVKYRTATAVYLSGGSADGLSVGDRLSVVARGATVGEVEVAYLAEHSASCTIVSEARPIRAGDVAVMNRKPPPETTVVDTPTRAAPAAATTEPPSPPPLAGALAPWARARGAVSLGWYRMWDGTPAGFDFEQRNGRADLSLWDVAGQPVRVNLRLRARQDLRTRPPGFSFENIPTRERRDRLYEASVRYDPPDGTFAFEAGRLGVPMLGVGTLDGALVEFRPMTELRLGGFFGNRADVYNFDSYAGGRKYGGYVRLTTTGGAWPGNWDAMAYGVRESAAGDVGRDYVGFQGRLAGRRVVFAQWAEVDLFRGWRQEAAGKSLQLSNLSLSASYRFGPGSSAGLSYDQRRSYPTPETRSLPEILFDRFLHQGFRASLNASRAQGLGVSAFVGVRLDDGGTGNAWSYGLGLRQPRVLGTELAASLDASAFTNAFTSGQQGSLRLARTSGEVTASLGYGLSRYSFRSGGDRRLNQWLRFSARADWSSGVWLSGDLQYDRGDDSKGPRAWVELGYRF